MNENTINIKISPETLSDILFQGCYDSGATYDSGCTFYYPSLSKVLSGGTNGESLLTGLTIPIVFTQNDVDFGYYSVFDGMILQADVVKNFIFSGQTFFPKRLYFYNTSEKEYKNFLNLSDYTVDWGDGTPPLNINLFSPYYVYHDYLNPGQYEVILTQKNPWGTNTVKKIIDIPITATTITNPNGTAYFTPNIGSWSATPISYDYLFTGDSINQISAQISENYTNVPFYLTGETKSRINELRLYGPRPFIVNQVIKDSNNNFFGMIDSINQSYTGYTIQDNKYLDLPDGKTIFFIASSGLIADWMVEEPITKDEALLNVVYTPEVQSDIYIERGKNSVLERIQRLGEINTIGDLTIYGYGFFNFNSNS